MMLWPSVISLKTSVEETKVVCIFMYVFQLLKLYEHLVSPLAQGVVQLVEEFGCRSIIRELVREISDTDSSDLMQDTSGARAYSQFLVEVAEKVPELIVPAINALTVHLDGEVCLIFLVLLCTAYCTIVTFTGHTLALKLEIFYQWYLQFLVQFTLKFGLYKLLSFCFGTFMFFMWHSS
jgi:hypothetical protein